MSTLSYSPDWANRAPPCFPPPWASAWGSDRYGLWAEFCLVQGDIVQRMRWVEAGSFMMGSPADEAGRFEDEGPIHYVTISQGFWLADTACTQALWQAVMGKNAGKIHADSSDGAEHPIRQIQWNMINPFLAKLTTLIPFWAGGYQATLPTEAEWEYACRADGQTAYSFGNTISKEWANYDGKGTVATKTLLANDWGLYEMHGNVWEWCADGFREYNLKDERDPSLEYALDCTDVANSIRRVLRGGSWACRAWHARSACRGRHQGGRHDADIGFRLALRFQSSQ